MTEFNICGVLVHSRRDRAVSVAARLKELPGVEVHAQTDEGRLVVTVEDIGDARCIDTISSFADVEGVLSTSLVYQQTGYDEIQQESAR